WARMTSTSPASWRTSSTRARPSSGRWRTCRGWRSDGLLLRRRLLLAELLDHLLLRRPGDRLVLGELHRVLALALRRRAEIRRVSEHLRQRHVRAGDEVALDRLRVLDDAAPLVELAHHRALEFLGRL